MPKENQLKSDQTPAPSEDHPTVPPLRPTGKAAIRPGEGAPGWVPEGVDSRFWSLWRAHVLAGIGLIAGYPMAVLTLCGQPKKTE